jgi:hypothetical protein
VCREGGDGAWHTFDDDEVTATTGVYSKQSGGIEEGERGEGGAYMLFYRRAGVGGWAGWRGVSERNRGAVEADNARHVSD